MLYSRPFRSQFGRTYLLIACVILGVCGLMSCEQAPSEDEALTARNDTSPVAQADPEEPTLALSLAVLQEQVTEQPQALPDELAHLGGLTRLDGFMIEPDGEIILLGSQDSESSVSLDLDTLVVALRNAFQLPSYTGVLGCTIDPWAGSDDPWRIQQVGVFGMPASAPMAARHVAIDYELKKVSAGLVSLGEEMPSLWAMHQTNRSLCATDADQTVQEETTHRFWFYPAYPPAPRFVEETGIVLIQHPVGVQLMIEQEFLDQQGRRTGATEAAPLAARFSRMITEVLATDRLPHYSQLRNDFRVIELAQLLVWKQVSARSVAYLLYDYPLPAVETPRYVGGIRREEQGQVVCDTEITERPVPGGTHVESQDRLSGFQHSSRGGVEAKIELAPEQFVEAPTGVLVEFRRRVLAARPSARALVWEITD